MLFVAAMIFAHGKFFTLHEHAPVIPKPFRETFPRQHSAHIRRCGAPRLESQLAGEACTYFEGEYETTFDLFARWTPMKNLDVNFSIQNLFDRKAPFDPYLVIPYGINYNQTWHQSGAVGRFLTVGAKYSF